MASLVKNQIVKALSGFTKNMTPDQLTFDVLRGKAPLEDIEVNEEVLAEKLELPAFLRLVSARCRHVLVDVPWRDLSKSVELKIAEISIFLRLCTNDYEEGEGGKNGAIINNQATPSVAQNSAARPYGFAEKLIECLRLTIDHVYIQFESDSFGGSVTLSNLVVSNQTPVWRTASNSKQSRFHDKTIRQVLFFKRVSWELLRIEASKNSASPDSTSPSEGRRTMLNSPLRIINSDGHARITIKKNTKDCSLLAGRLEVFVREVIWTATMVHFRSAIELYNHIFALAMRSRAKQQKQPLTNNAFTAYPAAMEALGSHQQTSGKIAALPYGSEGWLQRALHEFLYTSHHVNISTIQIHLNDDTKPEALPPSWGLKNADMEIELHEFTVDYYPDCPIGHGLTQQNCASRVSRRHWHKYQQQRNAFTDLVDAQLEHHFNEICSKIEGSARERFERVWPQLRSRNVVVRLADACVRCVSDLNTKRMRAFVEANASARKALPQNLSIFHMEIASYFFPGTSAFPVPPDAVHIQFSPLDVLIEMRTIRWLFYTVDAIRHAFEDQRTATATSAGPQPEIRIEFLMPCFILEPSTLHPSGKISFVDEKKCADDRDDENDNTIMPCRFFLHCSTITLTNYVLHKESSFPQPVFFRGRLSDDIINFVSSAQEKWPQPSVADITGLLHRKARTLISGPNQCASYSFSQTHTLGDASNNELFVYVPSAWVNAHYDEASPTASALIDDKSIGDKEGKKTFEQCLISDLILFACVQDCPRNNSIAIVVEPRNPVSTAVLDHFQYIQLIRLLDDATAMLDQIADDRRFFTDQRLLALPNASNPPDSPLGIFCHFDKLRVNLLLPTSTFSPYSSSLSLHPELVKLLNRTEDAKKESYDGSHENSFTGVQKLIQNAIDSNFLSSRSSSSDSTQGRELLTPVREQDAFPTLSLSPEEKRTTSDSGSLVVAAGEVSIGVGREIVVLDHNVGGQNDADSAAPSPPPRPPPPFFDPLNALNENAAVSVLPFTTTVSPSNAIRIPTSFSNICLPSSTGESIATESVGSSPGRNHHHSATQQHQRARLSPRRAPPPIPHNLSQPNFDMLEDTISLATTLSGGDLSSATLSLYQLNAFGGFDDGVEDADAAEEALEDTATCSGKSILEKQSKQDFVSQRQLALRAQTVNVLDVVLSDLNIYVNASGASVGEDVTTTIGYATSLNVADRIGERYGMVVDTATGCAGSGGGVSHSESFATNNHNNSLDFDAGLHLTLPPSDTTLNEPLLRLEVCSRSAPAKKPSTAISIDICGLKTTLDDAVISHLGPFVEDDRVQEENPPSLTVKIRNSNIQIKNDKKKFPMRICLTDLDIGDGPEAPSK